MGRKKNQNDDPDSIPRFKKKKQCDRTYFLKSQKKKPSMPLDDLKDAAKLKKRRQKKRREKREKQRRKDISKAVNAQLEECTASLQTMEVKEN